MFALCSKPLVLAHGTWLLNYVNFCMFPVICTLGNAKYVQPVTVCVFGLGCEGYAALTPRTAAQGSP